MRVYRFLSFASLQKLLLWTITGGCFVAVLGLLTPTAHADPHAVFYTTIGQQQLFFNVLAALDQADYVEPKELREKLLDERTKIAIQNNPSPAPEDPFVSATRTDLASILSRSVTLEGDDLWTAYLANQFAIESARRRNTDEVLRIYCQQGLGRKGCEEGSAKEFEEGKEKAFVVNPVERSAQGVLDGVKANIDSSNQAGSPDQNTRKEIVEASPESTDKRPYPFNPLIAQLEENVRGESQKELALERLRAGTKALFAPTGVNPTVYDELEIDSNTQIATLEQGTDESPQGYITRYMENVSSLLGVASSFQDSARQGVAKVTTAQKGAEREGALSDTQILPKKNEPATSATGNVQGISTAHAQIPPETYGALTQVIEVPAYAKAAATKEAINTLANTEQNLAFAPPAAETDIGQQQLVKRGGQAKGIATGNPQVLGDEDTRNVDFDPTHNDDLTKKLTPVTNPVGYHHEQGPAHLLKALGYQSKRGGCGDTCSHRSATNDFGQEIIRRINSM